MEEPEHQNQQHQNQHTRRPGDYSLPKIFHSPLLHRDMTFKPTIPKRTITTTANHIQSRIKPLTKSHVAKYRQNGLNPSIFDGKAIIRLPSIANSSFAVCCQLGLSDICIPSESLMFYPFPPRRANKMLSHFILQFCHRQNCGDKTP
jgi:hypothetical protein